MVLRSGRPATAVTTGTWADFSGLHSGPGIVPAVNPIHLAGILPSWLDAEGLVNTMGSWALLGIALIIFAECGLLIGFFLPGDTLLFISGLLVATGKFDVNLGVAIAVLTVAAFVGNMVGYGIGYKGGPLVFERPNARFFKQEYVEKSAAFFDRYGRRAVILARFVPVVRTVATVMAGVSKMNARVYATYSAIGGAIWVAGVTTAGYFLGQIDFIAAHIDIILVGAVVVVVLASAVPALLHVRSRRAGSAVPIDTSAGSPVLRDEAVRAGDPDAGTGPVAHAEPLGVVGGESGDPRSRGEGHQQ